MADSVRYIGPLYTHSWFSFEDHNGFLLKMIRGTQNIDNQITTGISFVQKLPEFRQDCLPRGSTEEELYEMISSSYYLKRNRKIAEGTYTLGSIKKKTFSDKEFQAVASFCGEAPPSDTFPSFNRIDINETIVYGLDYKRMIKRDNSGICFLDGNAIQFGRVKFFVQIPKDNNEECAAMVEILKCNNYSAKSNILAVKLTNNVKVVPLENIKSSCMFTCSDFSKKVGYVCLFPNKLESD